jgi:hypothetical protein
MRLQVPCTDSPLPCTDSQLPLSNCFALQVFYRAGDDQSFFEYDNDELSAAQVRTRLDSSGSLMHLLQGHTLILQYGRRFHQCFAAHVIRQR